MKFKSNAKYGCSVESGTIYEGKIGSLCISVHHIYGGKEWFLSCYDLNISQKGLKSIKLLDAIEESKEVLKKVVDKMQEDVNTFCKETIEITRY